MSSSIIINSFIEFPGGSGASDSDAAAFLTAAGITDPTIESAVDNLVIDLKAASLWALCDVIYPFVGGTATTNKYNLKDPQDTDGAFRASFSGGWTHAATGALPDGIDGVANTHYNGTTSSATDDSHLSMYARTTTAAGNKIDLVAFSGGTATWLIAPRYTGDLAVSDAYGFNVGNGRVTSASSSALGFWITTRDASNTKQYKDGAETGTAVNNVVAIANDVVYLGGLSGTSQFSDHEFAFASMGASLDATEASDFYDIVQAFQTALSRNI